MKEQFRQLIERRLRIFPAQLHHFLELRVHTAHIHMLFHQLNVFQLPARRLHAFDFICHIHVIETLNVVAHVARDAFILECHQLLVRTDDAQKVADLLRRLHIDDAVAAPLNLLRRNVEALQQLHQK